LLAWLLPFATMRGPHVDAFFSFGIDPTVEDATAWKHESMHAVVADDCEFKIAIKWRGGYRPPIHTSLYGNRFLLKASSLNFGLSS
jgi:hypothetical protein